MPSNVPEWGRNLVINSEKNGEFIIYSTTQHPSEYTIKIYSDEMQKLSDSKDVNKTVKKARKNKTWLEFNGFIEYSNLPIVPMDIPEFTSMFPNLLNPKSAIKQTEPVIIKILPQKNNHTTFNIYFKNNMQYGIGLIVRTKN